MQYHRRTRKINEKWENYFKILLNYEDEDITEDTGADEVVGQKQGQQGYNITKAEMEESVKNSKNDKTPGSDEFQTELIKEGNYILKKSILSILNKA